MKTSIFPTLAAILALSLYSCSSGQGMMVSPDGTLTASLNADSLSLTVRHNGQTALEIPDLGFLTSMGEGLLSVDSISTPALISESYKMITGKRSSCANEATERVVYLSDSADHRQKLRIRLYNDGIAFRYEFDSLSNVRQQDELTTYRIADGTRRWIMKWSDSYEGFFPMSEEADTTHFHWAYPVLLNPGNDTWCLITEANIERGQSASSLRNDKNPELYTVWPDLNDQLLSGEWHTPWRTVVIGSLADVVESTLVTDVSEPSKIADTSWLKPGMVSWIYWANNHGSNDYNIIKKYVDLAVDMKLPYMLVDAEWDEMKDGKTVEDALAYSTGKGITPLIWYSSSIGWIDGAPGPKFRLNDPSDREKEFAWCESNGIKGVKIDFFSGDSNQNMEYMIDLLESAAEHQLMVNFHGATIPRGWQRTYPNLMSVEAVYGEEWYNNAPVLTKRAASHNATLPFTRNVIGSMDYTPVAFSDSQHPHITTHAHELALAVVFESALQHLADRPESLMAQPDEVRRFLSELPTAWDDTRLLGGYPGEYAVLARRKGSDWYVGTLNGTDSVKVIYPDWGRMDLSETNGAIELFEDSGDAEQPWKLTRTGIALPDSILCQPRGGFAMRITPESR